MNKLTIGILGGMGPESTADIYLRMIRYCQEKYNARLDEEFPPIIIYNMPISDVVEKEYDKNTLKELEVGIKKLVNAGSDFLFIACNTMQKFVPELRKKTPVEILSIVEESLEYAKEKGYKKLGLMATKNTVNSNVYQKIFKKNKLEIVAPEENEQACITKVILEIMSGKKSNKMLNGLIEITQELRKKGADAIILGCTDLPLILNEENTGIGFLNTSQIIAESAIKKSFRGERCG